MYMNLCDEQALITKFNLTKETILQMPEKEIKFLLEQIHKEKEIDDNPILKNIVIVERLSNNDITWKFYKDYLLNKTDFKILSNIIPNIDEQSLYKYIKRYDDLKEIENKMKSEYYKTKKIICKEMEDFFFMSVLKCERTFTQLTIDDKMLIFRNKIDTIFYPYLDKSRNIPRFLYKIIFFLFINI